MGCCMSKTKTKTNPFSKPPPNNKNVPQTHQNELKIATHKIDTNVVPSVIIEEKEKEKEKEVAVVLEVRKSSDRSQDSTGCVSNSSDPNLMAAEEVDAILIQCGRLSRSSSGNEDGKRYCGSKRSFDFDKENGNEEKGEGEEGLRRRESRGSSRRRGASSRSRERVEQRSGSKERSGGGSGRRVSRSPGRRSQSPISRIGNGSNNSGGNGNGRPGKLVSVPATVTSLSIDKSNIGIGGVDNGNVKRVLVKGSPRSQSPAKGNQASGNGNGRSQSPAKGNQASGNGNGGQPLSLSRNGSRKAEKSPYRRTPLNEIDMNSLPFQPLANKRSLNKGKEIDETKHAVETVSSKAAIQGTHRRTRSRGAEGYEVTKTNYCRVNGPHTPTLDRMTDDKREQLNAIEYDAMVTPIILSGTETLKLPQTLMRSRSARRSRDLDINLDSLLSPVPTLTPTTNYTSLLLKDIQNFHQNKNPNPNSNSNSNSNSIIYNTSESTPSTLPPCVSKAHSILEAVADLNSTTRSRPEIATKPGTTKKRLDPFVKSEVEVGNAVIEPSLHKNVTVRKRGGVMDDEESTGSNSIVINSQLNVVSSSSWEPNSADSTDRWTSKTYSREDEFSPVGFQRHATSDQ